MRRADTHVDVPVGIAYQLWEQRQRIPDWMPIIAAVQARLPRTGVCKIAWMCTVLIGRSMRTSVCRVSSSLCVHARRHMQPALLQRHGHMPCRAQDDPEDPDISTWTLRATFLGRQWQLEWKAQNRAPTRCACNSCLDASSIVRLPLQCIVNVKELL